MNIKKSPTEENLPNILELLEESPQPAGEPTISKSARISRMFAFLALGSVIVFWLLTLFDSYYFLDLFFDEGLLLFGLSLAAITCASIGLKLERLTIVLTIVTVAGFLAPLFIILFL
jgi:hypothetical protein